MSIFIISLTIILINIVCINFYENKNHYTQTKTYSSKSLPKDWLVSSSLTRYSMIRCRSHAVCLPVVTYFQTENFLFTSRCSTVLSVAWWAEIAHAHFNYGCWWAEARRSRMRTSIMSVVKKKFASKFFTSPFLISIFLHFLL